MLAQRVTPAKITQPHPRRFYPRTRLFGLLNDAEEVPCVWICGSPGAGKTTLAASYCDHTDNTTLWYQVDEGDADVANFFYYLNQAAKKVTRRRKDLPLFTAEFTGGLKAFSRRYFEKLYSWLKLPFVLVLDNYQLVGPDSPIHEVIVSALETLPAGGQIMVLSRQGPPTAFARSRANQHIHVIDWPALRLDPVEVSEIAKLHKSDQLSSQELHDLEARSDGWVAGLVLMLQGAVQVMPRDRQPHDDPHAMFDYFAQEIFRQQPKDIQTILMQAALLPKMNGEILRELTGHDTAGRLLSELHQRNYFVHRHGRSKASYQFHPLFRDFLLTKLREENDHTELERLQVKAAHVLESAEDPEAAIDLYQNGGEFAAAVRLICDLAPALVAQSRSRTLRSWITQLPKASIDETPWLSYWLACCDLFFDPAGALKNFEVAYRCFKATHDVPGTFLAWSGAVDSIHIQVDDYTVLKKWIVSGEQLLLNNPVFPSVEIETRVVASMCFALTHSRPDHPMLPTLSARAQELWITIPDSSSRLMLGLMMYESSLWRYGAVKARLLLKNIATPGSDAGVGDAWRTFQYAGQAVFEFMTGDQESALRTTKTGLALCDESGVDAFRIFLLAHGAWAALSSGDQSLGRKYIRSLGAKTAGTLHRSIYYQIHAWLDWSTGQTAAALEKMMIAFADMEKSGHVFGVAMMHLMLSNLRLALGELQQGRTNLDEALRIAEAGHSGWIKFNYFFIDASYKLKQDQETACLDALRQGFGVGRELELYTTLWWDPVRMSRLCTAALEHNIEVDYVQEMIRRNRLAPDTSAAALKSWPWPIRIYVLGTFRLAIDGKTEGFDGQRQKKVIELLKALVVFGRQDVSATRLTDALWPDSDGYDANNALKTAVHRLRKLLGRPDAIEVSVGHLSLSPRYCWTDLGGFEQSLQEARIDADKSATLEQAMNGYGGSLLESEEEASWLIGPRERVRGQFLNAVTLLGQILESKQEWTTAIDTYERALEIDCLIEPFYRQLMHCHRNLGHHAEAISTYDRCTKVLAAELGVEPSHELQTLRNVLLNS